MKLIYKALMTQVGENDPTIIEFENTLGSIDWVRNGAGDYLGTKNGFFDENKTLLLTNNFTTSGYVSNFYVDSINTIGIQTKTEIGGVLTDDILYKHSILIEVDTN